MRILIKKYVDEARYIDFGYKTKLFQQTYFITSGVEYYNIKGEVYYATQDFALFKHIKWWRISKIWTFLKNTLKR